MDKSATPKYWLHHRIFDDDFSDWRYSYLDKAVFIASLLKILELDLYACIACLENVNLFFHP